MSERRRRRKPHVVVAPNPEGYPNVVGIDLSGTKLAVSIFPGCRFGGTVFQRFRPLPPMARTLKLAIGTLTPGLAFVEAEVVAGGRVKTTLMQARATGAVILTLESLGWRVSLVPIGTWKKTIVGNGNASKHQIGEWFTANPPPPITSIWNEDTIDAYAIGLYGVDVARTARALDAARSVPRSVGPVLRSARRRRKS